MYPTYHAYTAMGGSTVMPTKEDLSSISNEYVVKLMTGLLLNVDRHGALFVLIQVYELFSILICKDIGCSRISDKDCFSKYKDWYWLLYARNTVSHNYYNEKSMVSRLSALLQTDLLQQLCRDYLGDENLPNYLLMKLGILKEEMK